MFYRKLLLPVLALLLAALACASPVTLPAISPTLSITTTPQPPEATATLNLPTLEPSATPTAAPAGKTTKLKIFLIALEDGGVAGKKIGCNDSVVPVTVEVPKTSGVLRAALTQLLAQRDQYYGQSGLYNALYQSNLEISSLSLKDGKAVVKLKGDFTLGGECDSPRVKAQLVETARQFKTVSKVTFYINGKLLDDLLSGR